MLKKLTILAAGLAMLVTAPASADHGGKPSAKAVAAIGNTLVLRTTTDLGWQELLSADLKTANKKELAVDVSLECGVDTLTVAKSKGGNKETGKAFASVMVRVLVDGVEAEPGPVVFCQRNQELSATFQGIFTTDETLLLNEVTACGALGAEACTLGDILNDEDCAALEALDENAICSETKTVSGTCLIIDPDTGQPVLDEDCLTPEIVELLIETLNANAFNFLARNVEQGVHTITIEAAINTEVDSSCETEPCSTTDGDQEAGALIGKGSVLIESLRFINGHTVID